MKLGMVVTIAAAAVAAGCGEELVPGTQVDVPLFTLEGYLVGAGDGTPVRAGVLWADPFGELDDLPSPRDVTVATTEANGSFTLRFFRPPPDRMIRRVADPMDPRQTAFAFAFAEIVAFEDVDHDETFKVNPRVAGSTIADPDRYRGYGGEKVIFYIEQQRTDSMNVIPELDAVLTLPPGYYQAAVGCSASVRGQTAPVWGDEQLVPIPLVAATSAFPEMRSCLRSHPPPAAP